MYQVTKETASMYARDGIRLDADIYRPISAESFPVLLMRQPYGRAIASTVVYAHPRWYAARGYVVVVQDVRGRGTSEGEFELFAREMEDGYDAVIWASQLDGTTGQVGMYGFSYQGMTQLYAAAKQPEPLKTVAPAAIALDLYSDWAYENGAFCYQINLAWAVQLAAETARLKGDATAYKILYLASKNLPLWEHPSIFQEALRKYAPSNFYYQWLNHPDSGEYWQELSPRTHLAAVDLPMLHIGGWFDPHLRGTLNLYGAMREKSSCLQHLIIGPWGHLPWGNRAGDRYFGKSANSPVDGIQIAWFDRFLKGIDSEIFTQGNIYLFEMGSNDWQYFNNFPSQDRMVFYLKSTGLASIRDDSGKLLREKNNYFDHNEDVIVHDFWRPAPSLGGHAAIPSGPYERSTLDNRSDILTYTSAILTADLAICGTIEVILDCQTEARSFDLCAIASEVLAGGKVYNFTQGYVRVKERQEVVTIPLQPTCIKIAKGSALRLSVSVACFPAYTLNYGKQADLSDGGAAIQSQTLTLILNSNQKAQSRLIIPITQKLTMNFATS